MTLTTSTDLLLEATGVTKHMAQSSRCGLRPSAVVPGEFHTLLGANGAGQEHAGQDPDGRGSAGRRRNLVRGQRACRPLSAGGPSRWLVSVYQEPSLIADLDVGRICR